MLLLHLRCECDVAICGDDMSFRKSSRCADHHTSQVRGELVVSGIERVRDFDSIVESFFANELSYYSYATH